MMQKATFLNLKQLCAAGQIDLILCRQTLWIIRLFIATPFLLLLMIQTSTPILNQDVDTFWLFSDEQ